MLGHREPALGVAGELFRRAPGVELEQYGDRLEAVLARPREVTRKQRLDHGFLGQLGARLGRLAQATEDEQRLHVRRALAPQRPVVVEHGYALRGRHEVRAALLGDAIDEVDDRRPGRPIVPGGKRQWPEVSALSSFSTTWSIVKLAAFWRGGNSWNVARNCATSVVAASTM